MKNKIIYFIVGIIFSFTIIGMGGCSSCSRGQKTWESDWGGGLDRTVTLYSNNGEEIRSWDGKIDLSNSEEEIMFDLNNKRTIIHGGIVVVQEN